MGGPREFFTATCSNCGGEARAPFQPRGDKPVYAAHAASRSGRRHPVAVVARATSAHPANPEPRLGAGRASLVPGLRDA